MIAIKASESGDVIFFDVVTRYSRGFQSQVTKHPVDGAGTVSDHVIKQNPTITVKGFVSGADFNSDSFASESNLRQALGTGNVYGERQSAGNITITSGPEGLITSITQSAIGQFLTEEKPKITGYDQSREDSEVVKKLESIRDSKEAVTLHEFDREGAGGTLSIVRDMPEESQQRAYLTGLNINEDAQNGDGKSLTLTFEIVTITTLQTAVVPENTEVQEQSAGMEAKGNQAVNPNDVETVDNGADTGSLLSPAAQYFRRGG